MLWYTLAVWRIMDENKANRLPDNSHMTGAISVTI